MSQTRWRQPPPPEPSPTHPAHATHCHSPPWSATPCSDCVGCTQAHVSPHNLPGHARCSTPAQHSTAHTTAANTRPPTAGPLIHVCVHSQVTLCMACALQNRRVAGDVAAPAFCRAQLCKQVAAAPKHNTTQQQEWAGPAPTGTGHAANANVLHDGMCITRAVQRQLCGHAPLFGGVSNIQREGAVSQVLQDRCQRRRACQKYPGLSQRPGRTSSQHHNSNGRHSPQNRNKCKATDARAVPRLQQQQQRHAHHTPWHHTMFGQIQLRLGHASGLAP